MQTNIENVFRYDRSDPESRQKLDRLIEEFGVSLPELLSETFTQLLDIPEISENCQKYLPNVAN